MPTWLDYLRLMEHMTSVDIEVARSVLTFHNGTAPPVTRFLLAHVSEGGGTQQPAGSTFRRSVYDVSLSPTMISDAGRAAATPGR